MFPDIEPLSFSVKALLGTVWWVLDVAVAAGCVGYRRPCGLNFGGSLRRQQASVAMKRLSGHLAPRSHLNTKKTANNKLKTQPAATQA